MIAPRLAPRPAGAAVLTAGGALCAALVAGACDGDGRPAGGAPISGTMRGPDAVLVRVPRAGGRVTAAVYPRLDSAVWRSRDSAPPIARVLAFDPDAGLLAAVDTAGLPVRMDLRLGTVRTAGKAPLSALAASGGTFYGVTRDGRVTRLTTSGGDWDVRLTPTPQALYPQRDGTVLAAGARGGAGVLWTLRPPTPRATDSVRVPGGARPVRLGAADRVYFTGGDELLGVQARTLAAAAPVALGAGLRAAAASPSGDRLFVLTDRASEVGVVDRYAGAVSAAVRLPGAARDLRVDPLGRYLLVRPAAAGDSAWVLAVGTGRVLGAVRGAWRDDLPLVAPDGAILTAQGEDVAVVDGETLRTRATVAGGASDFWHLVLWNGFRPRAAGLDRPATFRAPRAAAEDASADSATPDSAPTDTAEPPPAPAESSGGEPVPIRPTVPAPPFVSNAGAVGPALVRPVRFVPSVVRGEASGEVDLPNGDVPLAAQAPAPPTPAAPGPAQPSGAPVRAGRAFTVQFAAAPSEREARRALARLRLPGTTLRVVPRGFDGQTVYRVVAGPFATRAEAERVGRAAGAGNYWVYGGAP